MIPSSGLLQMPSADASQEVQEAQITQIMIRKILMLILMEVPVQQIQTRIAPMYLDAIAVNGLGHLMTPSSGPPQMPCADVSQEAQTTQMIIRKILMLILMEVPVQQIQTKIAAL